MEDTLLNKRKYTIVPRSEFLEVIQRRKFENSELKEKKKALYIARDLGASIVVFGFYKVKGDNTIVHIRVADVRTGKILYKYQHVEDLSLRGLTHLSQNFIVEEGKRPESVFKSMPKPPKSPPIPLKIGVKIGYPLVFGFVAKNQADIKLPFAFLGFFFNHSALGNHDLFFEYELGYFGYEWKSENGFVTNRVHGFPLTASLGGEINLSNRFFFWHC